MNIFAFEFKRHLRMTLLFTLFLAVFSSGMLFFYMFIKEDLDMMMVFFDRFPAPMKAMMSSDISIVTTLWVCFHLSIHLFPLSLPFRPFIWVCRFTVRRFPRRLQSLFLLNRLQELGTFL